MSTEKRTLVLLVGGEPALADALTSAGYSVLSVPDDDDLYARLGRDRPDAVVIAADLPSRDALEHLAILNRKHPQPMLLFHDGKDEAIVRRAARAGVSAYVAHDLAPAVLRSLIEVATQHFEQMHALKREVSRLQQAQAERRLIDAAKTRVMEALGISESEAYKRLQTQAMNDRRSVADVARALLGKSGNEHEQD